MEESDDVGQSLLSQAESNLKMAIGSFDPYTAGEKPAALTAIATVYKMLYELHGGKTDPVTPEQVQSILKEKGLEIVPIRDAPETPS